MRRLATFIVISFFLPSAFAAEPISRILLNEATKQELIGALSARISIYERMSREQIINDMESTAKHNLLVIQRRAPERAAHYQDAVKRSLASVRALSKDQILVREHAEIQGLMTADEDRGACDLFDLTANASPFLWIVTVPLDIVVGIPLFLLEHIVGDCH